MHRSIGTGGIFGMLTEHSSPTGGTVYARLNAGVSPYSAQTTASLPRDRRLCSQARNDRLPVRSTRISDHQPVLARLLRPPLN